MPMGAAAQVDLFTFTSEYLADSGYTHYEISNFAKGEGNHSRHNSAYWKMVPYTGFGPSAHSYWIQPDKGRADRHVRSWNRADLGTYIESLAATCLPVGGHETLTPSQQMLERIMVGLRTRNGIDIAAFDALSPFSFRKDFKELVRRLERERLGRIRQGGTAFVLTREGWACLDNIIESFVRNLSSNPF